MMNLATNDNVCKATYGNSHDKVKRVGIYARVSTNHQNLDVQLTELRAVAKQRGWTIVNEYMAYGVGGVEWILELRVSRKLLLAWQIMNS